MDPLDVNFVPPPAYSEEEFDQKTSKATELSLELVKRETPKAEIDEEGFPRYDPAMFEEPSRTQKGKDQPTATTFRSSSISKRPLPNPKSSTSSTNAGPSTRRQTQPLHISKKSISKAEEGARDPTTSASTPSIKDTQEDIPPYAPQSLPASAPSPQSIPAQSIDDPPEDNPPYTPMDLHVSTPSIPTQSIEDTPEDNPPYEPNYPSEPPYDEQPQLGDWEEGITSRQDVVSEPVPDEPLDRPQIPEPEPPEQFRQRRETLNPNTATMANQMPDSYSMASNPPFHRGPQLLNSNTAAMPNQMLDSQSQYSMAHNPPVHRGSQQHYSLPPAPRILPRIHPSDRPRSQSTIPTSPSTLPKPTVPRVLFNPNVAYGRNTMGGQFRPKAQAPQTSFQAPYDPTTLYNSAVSSHLNTPMTTPDQLPHLSYPVQRPQVWPNQTYPTPANSAVNQPRQWGWHPPGRPSNTYHPVSDTSYGGGGTDVSRYSHHSVTNNGYFSQ